MAELQQQLQQQEPQHGPGPFTEANGDARLQQQPGDAAPTAAPASNDGGDAAPAASLELRRRLVETLQRRAQHAALQQAAAQLVRERQEQQERRPLPGEEHHLRRGVMLHNAQVARRQASGSGRLAGAKSFFNESVLHCWAGPEPAGGGGRGWGASGIRRWPLRCWAALTHPDVLQAEDLLEQYRWRMELLQDVFRPLLPPGQVLGSDGGGGSADGPLAEAAGASGEGAGSEGKPTVGQQLVAAAVERLGGRAALEAAAAAAAAEPAWQPPAPPEAVAEARRRALEAWPLDGVGLAEQPTKVPAEAPPE